VLTARYALSPYIKQIRFVFKGLNFSHSPFNLTLISSVVLLLQSTATRRRKEGVKVTLHPENKVSWREEVRFMLYRQHLLGGGGGGGGRWVGLESGWARGRGGRPAAPPPPPSVV
jgi:hypothetical protein